MLFSSIPFLYYFLPVVLVLYFAVPKVLKNPVLLFFHFLSSCKVCFMIGTAGSVNCRLFQYQQLVLHTLVWRWGAISTLQAPTCECELRHLSSQQIHSSHTITVDRMAPPARIELTTNPQEGLVISTLLRGRINIILFIN